MCLARFHEVPPAKLQIRLEASSRAYDLVWIWPTPGQSRGHGNTDEATRDGAYAMALAAAHGRPRMMTLGRSENRTGADWYLVPVDGEPVFDLDQPGVVRFEVSGVSDDTEAKLRQRVREKVEQVGDRDSMFPGWVGVVGFSSPVVVIRKA